MKSIVTIGIVAAWVMLQAAVGLGDDNTHRFGAGVHYWRTIDNVDLRDVDENGLSWYASYQYRPSLLGIEADVEWFQKGFAGSPTEVFAPQVFLIVGKSIYAAVGIGTYYADDTLSSNPFYALRAGLDLELLPFLFVDINANYRFEDWDDLDVESRDIGTDTVTLGGAVRITF